MSKTPYARQIQDDCDNPHVGIVAVSASARWGKTIMGENRFLRMAEYGPLVDMLWFMQSDTALDDYIDQIGEWNLENHPGINARINWKDRRNSRKRKEIGKALALWRVATERNMIAKAAKLIVVDEVDNLTKRVLKKLMALLRNRQRQYGSGSGALIYLASHPDAGPTEGITKVISDGQNHHWYWRCVRCGGASSPCKGAEVRCEWNLDRLMEGSEGMERKAILERVLQNACLICPHCQAEIDNDMRLEMTAGGVWIQPGVQTLNADGSVAGERVINHTMGYTGHAFMSTIIEGVGKIAQDWLGARLDAEISGDDTLLKEETCKSLGEVYDGFKPEEVVEREDVLRRRMARAYPLTWVPPGVDFIVQFIDVQGDRFVVRVIGYARDRRTWLIDAYERHEWPPGSPGQERETDPISPANRLASWLPIVPIICDRTYPLIDRPGYALPIARTMVNEAGEAGVQLNARIWAANEIAKGAIQPYRLKLFIGGKRDKFEQITKDDNGRPLSTPLYVQQIEPNTAKDIIANRMKIEEGPGAMAIPSDLPDKVFRELLAERKIAGKWTLIRRRNELLDAYVACNAGCEALKPDRPDIDWSNPPEWATPIRLGDTIGAGAAKSLSYWDRLAAYTDRIMET